MIKTALRLVELGPHGLPCRVQDKRPATANGVGGELVPQDPNGGQHDRRR